jgi:hypothetical protein
VVEVAELITDTHPQPLLLEQVAVQVVVQDLFLLGLLEEQETHLLLHLRKEIMVVELVVTLHLIAVVVEAEQVLLVQLVALL